MPIEHDVTEAAGVAAGVVSDEVVEAVVSDAAAGGVDLLGPDGVLAELTKRILERALAEEMTDHLGYESGDPMGHGTGNNRNGTSPKQVLTEIGAVDLDVPRDRNATFEPRIVPKGARRLERFNSNIVALYARGLSTRDIRLELKRMYGVDVSPALVSKVTDGILEELTDWQNRPLDGCYPLLYIDAMVVKVRTNGTVINRPAYVVVGVDVDGRKHVLGVWLGDGGEGAKYWLSVLTEIRNRGLEDALIVCCDGLKGLPDAIEATWPQALVQTCVDPPAASLDAALQLEKPKNHCGGLATRLHRGKRPKPLLRRWTSSRNNGEIAIPVLYEYGARRGKSSPRSCGSRQSFAKSCTQPTSSKASITNSGKSPKPGGISPPTNPLSSCCASPPET